MSESQRKPCSWDYEQGLSDAELSAVIAGLVKRTYELKSIRTLVEHQGKLAALRLQLLRIEQEKRARDRETARY